jgi:RNA polymerase sigma factor (sigma-70 family)
MKCNCNSLLSEGEMTEPQNAIDKRKICSGDEDEWEKLFEQYYPILGEHAHRIVNDTHLANDIAEIVLLKLWEKKSTVLHVKFLKAYLIRAAQNEALTYIKKVADKREISYSFEIEIPVQLEKANDPRTIAQQRELRKIISTSIKKLSPRQREVINHILADTDTSTRALGKAVGCSHKNVQAIIRRIRVRFHKIYKLLKE